MHSIHDGSLAVETMSPAEQEAVREQLNRLLETHHFKNSRRYPALLRFIVEETLEGRGEYLKERLLGVRVFDRPANYDTASDPIVRVTIAEIRKRIAQYYHDEAHDAEMRIELQTGRYAPEFRSRSVRAHEVDSAAIEPTLRPFGMTEVVLPAPPAVPAVAARVRSGQRIWLIWSVCTAVVIVLMTAGFFIWLRPSALEVLWAPILSTQRSVLICIPTDAAKKHGPAGEPIDTPTAIAKGSVAGPSGRTFLDFESLGQNVVYSDMLAALRIGNVMAVRHRDYRVRLNVATTLEDLRQGPAVLIGGLDNQWTMRALAPLRFHFAGSDDNLYWIADRNDPGNRGWSLDLKQMYGSVTRDYAVIARLHNEQTGQPEMIVAGIGMSGTAAAGEFLADDARVRELRQRIGTGFKDRDFEAVLSTDVVNGIAGSPKILAVTAW